MPQCLLYTLQFFHLKKNPLTITITVVSVIQMISGIKMADVCPGPQNQLEAGGEL